MANSKSHNILKIDRMASVRLYLLSIPPLFGVLAYATLQKEPWFTIALCCLIISCFLPIIKCRITFNPNTLEIHWLFGLPFLFFTTEEKEFKDVASLLRGKGITSITNAPIPNDPTYRKIESTTRYSICLQLKNEKKLRTLFRVEDPAKADAICEAIAKVLFFEEKPNAGDGKRQWSRKKGPRN